MALAEFSGRHYETGTITNLLASVGVKNPLTGAPFTEGFVLGASGGAAFGYFVFEYKGYLPHVALLTRNTFDPFLRALDNLGVRREVRETTNEEKGEENLRRELDMGNPVVVWADSYSMPYKGLNPEKMWAMLPLLVVGYDGDDYLVVDESKVAFNLHRDDLNGARARVKKDRFRTMVFESIDEKGLYERSKDAARSAVALFLDEPPAGAATNFGAEGMRFMAKMLLEKRNAKSWARQFEPGPRLKQALAGEHGQPGVWDWVTRWSSDGAADRMCFAEFLQTLSDPIHMDLREAADAFRQSASLWVDLAEGALPDSIPSAAKLKEVRRKHDALWFECARSSDQERIKLKAEMLSLESNLSEPGTLTSDAGAIQADMSARLLQILAIEESAFHRIRSIIP